MLASRILSADEALDARLSQLRDAVGAVRVAAREASPAGRANAACVTQQAADELTAITIECIDTTDIETATGLSAEMLLQLEAGRLGSEARMLTTSASTLRGMPKLAGAFNAGLVSWGQVRSIVLSTKTVRAEGRAAIDELIGANAPALVGTDPDRIVALVDDAVNAQRAELAAARENRAVEKSFLSIQGRLDNTVAFYGEGDAVSGATIIAALDAAADPPEDPDKNGVSRAQQRYQGLLRISEAYLCGSSSGSSSSSGRSSFKRPKAKILATMDIKDLTDPASADAIKLLWPLRGRPARLTSVSRDMLLCDATIVPVILQGGQPVAVGDAADIISDKVRTALIARDAGCRFPGCEAPAHWCDAHHIIPGVGNQANDLILLCRRCHRRLHNRKWRMQLALNGGVTFTRRGQTHTTYPHHRPPPALE